MSGGRGHGHVALPYLWGDLVKKMSPHSTVQGGIYTIKQRRCRQNQSRSKLAVNHRAGRGNRTTTIQQYYQLSLHLLLADGQRAR